MTNKTVWVLADDRAGNTGQSLGVAEALGFDVEIKKIQYTSLVKLPNFLRGKSCIGITQESKEALKAPFPDVVISAGRRSAPVLRYIKKKSKGQTKIIQIMFPGSFGLSDFDLVVLPNHDGYKSERPNILRITGATHRITSARLVQEKEKWTPVFKDLPSKRLALIVGGATKDMPFTPEMAENLMTKTKELAKEKGVQSIFVTTSRRTGDEQEKIIQASLEEPFYFYSWANKEVENPYFGYLALSDYIVVTGDSMSMCSEACASEAEVYIFAPADNIGKKHKRLHQELYTLGYAKPLDAPLKEEGTKQTELNAARDVATKIKEMVG